MRITVKVKTGARQEKIEKAPDGTYKVWTKAVPEKGLANEAVIGMLSEHLGLAKSLLTIVRGHTATIKVVEFGGDMP